MSNYRYEGYGVVRDLRDDFPYHTDDIVELLDEKDQQIVNLEAQIAEMQNKSFILYSMLYETLEKQGSEDIASQIDQMTGLMLEKQADWFKGNKLFNQTAIEKLEKVKKLLVEKMKLASDKLDCAYYINQQINELKGE